MASEEINTRVMSLGKARIPSPLTHAAGASRSYPTSWPTQAA